MQAHSGFCVHPEPSPSVFEMFSAHCTPQDSDDLRWLESRQFHVEASSREESQCNERVEMETGVQLEVWNIGIYFGLRSKAEGSDSVGGSPNGWRELLLCDDENNDGIVL